MKKLQQGFFIYQVICKTAEKQCCCGRKCKLQNSPKWQSLFLSNNSHSVKEVLIRKKIWKFKLRCVTAKITVSMFLYTCGVLLTAFSKDFTFRQKVALKGKTSI
jgi:hypothetical protein